MDGEEQRWIGIGGLVFVVLVVVAVVLVPNPPAAHASAAKLASFYTKDKGKVFLAQGFVTMAAVIVGVFWFWYFRDLLVQVAGGAVAGARRLATVGFAGAILLAASGGVAAGLEYAIYDAAGHASPSTIQLLNYFNIDLGLGLSAAGVVVFLLATAIVVIRSRALPVWLGWLAVLFAVASFAVTPFAVICFGVWMIPANIVLIIRSRAAAEQSLAPAV